MCDKGCGLVFTTEFGLPQLAGQFTFMWQVFLRKSHMRVKILNDRLLIFCFAAITLFLPPCPMCTFPLSFLYKATQAHTHTRTEHGEKNLPPPALHPITLLLWERFWLICIDCYGPFSIPGALEQETPPKKLSLLIHQSSTCQTLAQENCHKFFFLLFSSWQITVMSQTVRREQWSAFCLPFSIANWILCNPSEHACTVEVSHHRWTSTTDTIATTGKKTNTTCQSFTDTSYRAWNCSLTPYTPTTTLFHSLLSPQLRHVGLHLEMEKSEGCHLFLFWSFSYGKPNISKHYSV